MQLMLLALEFKIHIGIKTAQVINDITKASPALVPQLQLWRLHWHVYVQSVGVLHSQLP
jgi:hypothetical protein